MDSGFLEAFIYCLRKLGYTSDQENMETLSMLTSLQEIWPQELKDGHLAIFELQGKIQQCKQQVVVWCGNLMRSSRQFYYSNSWEVLPCLTKLEKNLNDFSRYRADRIVPLKKQIDILKEKMLFLEEYRSIVRGYPDKDKVKPFVDFLGDFACRATFLTCLYWAKEDNEDITTDMNSVLFDMLQKVMPASWQFGCFFLGKNVETLVDFFFEHLAFILKDDDFQLLRDGLIFLFTFLTDPPCENAEDEDLIRSQIRALLHDDAYLLLPFNEMKEDFSNKRILLSDCMIMIDTAVAKIRQLYRGIPDSWIILELEKMIYIYFIPIERELAWIEKHAQWAGPDTLVVGQLQLYRFELKFLKMLLLCFVTWDDNDEQVRVRLGSMITSLQGIWRNGEEEKGFLTHRLHAIRRTRDIIDWHPLSSELEEKFQLSKLEIEACSVNLFYLSFPCKPSKSYKILKFVDSILDSLDDLVSYKAGEIVLFKKQIENLEEKIVFLRRFLKLPVNCIDSKALEEFKMLIQVFANDTAWLIFLYWAKDANDQFSSERNSMFSHMLQKIKPTTPHVARLYFGAIKAVSVQRSDSLMLGQIVFSFVYHFLEDPLTHLQDDFRILRDDIIFLLSFLNDPPDGNAKELICSQIDALFSEDVYGLLPFDDRGGDFCKKKLLLSDFMEKIKTLKSNIRQTYCKFPDSSLYNFPKVVSPQFLDLLVQNLRIMKEGMISNREYAPFAKYMIMYIEEELISLCPLFNHIFDLQTELTDTWLQVVDLVHLTEHVTSSWFSSWFVFDHPIWYHMANLSDVFNEIKVVKTKLEKIKESAMYHASCLPLPRSTGLGSTLSEQAIPSQINEIFVGLEDEVKIISDKLIWGHTSLDIVSVVGMGGLGKTTIAKKVYDSVEVKSNFHVFGFSCVSQDHNSQRLLIDILCDIKEGNDHGLRDMTEDDLAHELWKSLSGQKYLIVLDDVWDVSVWNKIKSSFPDDKNGSRVMFTTRSNLVDDTCKLKCSPHHLRFMSEFESWDLLRKKVFRDGISPPHLYDIGRQIAINCKGLPLAVCVISGLLSKTEESLTWWSEVAERVASYLSEGGCMEILELSYKHLPEDLKPCLVYLAEFPEDMTIRVKKVIMLWIGEGFIRASETKGLEEVAKDYLYDLVDRSLIIACTRNYKGRVETFRVHDLIRELCQTKCRDKNIFKLNHGIVSSVNNYRVSMQNRNDVNIAAGSSLSNARSLLYISTESDNIVSGFPLSKARLAQVLDLDIWWQDNGIEQLSSMPLLRHIDATLAWSCIPPSISNLWNLGSLALKLRGGVGYIHVPKTIWRMKSLRRVKLMGCVLKFLDGHENEVFPRLDKVVSFSKPVLSTGKDVQRLLQRLPSVQRLSCFLEKSIGYEEEESIEKLDFHRELESLALTLKGKKSRYLINFPSTLKKLTLEDFKLPSTAILSSIAELHCLEVLKLRRSFLPEPRLDMEDLTFQNLIFLVLTDDYLVEWNASTDSFPCLEHLVIYCPELKELPVCFGEMSSLKQIVVYGSSSHIKSSTRRIQKEQEELGNKVSVSNM